jgi:pimeloyl-ACP methyl ester carboxylesterase
MQNLAKALKVAVVLIAALQLRAQEPQKKKPEPGSWSDPSAHKDAFLNANGIRLNYLDWGGSGPDLVLIHGLSQNAHIFDDLAPALTDGFHVIAYTRRGHGRSDAYGPFDTATLTEDLRALMDALGIRKAHLAGWSMGGSEITAMAGSHPERVRSVIYLDAGYDWSEPAGVAELSSAPWKYFAVPPGDLRSFDAFRAHQLALWFPFVHDANQVEAYLRELVIRQPDGSVLPRDRESAMEALYTTLTRDRKDYTKVHSPALAIYAATMANLQYQKDAAARVAFEEWEKQYVIPFRAASIERIRRELPGVEILKVPGTHNDFIFAARAEVLSAMRRFLSAAEKSKAESPER